MWTGMKIFIELRDGVSLLIPFREASKVCIGVSKLFSLHLFFYKELAMGWQSQRGG